MSPRCWRCPSSTRDARRRSTTSPRAANAKRSCATRTRSCAHSRTSRTRWSRSTTNGTGHELLQSAAASADAALGRAQSLYDRGQIDLLPLLDAQRVRLVVRVSANDSAHATAARQRATVQGARRWLAGVRARRRSRCVRQPEFADIMKLRRSLRGTVVNPSLAPALVVVAVIAVAVLSACTSKPAPEALRAVRTAEIRYDKAQETNRYVGTVQSRHEVERGISRRRQGRAAQGRRRPEGARGRRAGGARRHRLPARRGRGAAAARRRHDAGAAGRVGSAAARAR